MIGCSGFARADFRLREDSAHYLLELNTLPGLTGSSLVPKAAQAAGIPFSELIERICLLSMEN